jgi:hypothetical protein
MTDFGLGDDIVNEDKREAALAWHFGTHYYQPKKPQPVELLASPPYAAGKDYESACGTGAWLPNTHNNVENRK